MNGVITFTERQEEVIRLLARGCSINEIAAKLGISPTTVKGHTDTIRHKLGVERVRQIPQAYLIATGINPLAEEAHQ